MMTDVIFYRDHPSAGDLSPKLTFRSVLMTTIGREIYKVKGGQIMDLKAIYKIASSTARSSISRGRPKGLAAGICGSISAHSASVTSLAYSCPSRSYFRRVISVHILCLDDCLLQPSCYDKKWYLSSPGQIRPRSLSTGDSISHTTN